MSASDPTLPLSLQEDPCYPSYQIKDVCALVAAAVAKLSLVLSSDWIRSESGNGMSNNLNNNPSNISSASSSVNNLNLPLIPNPSVRNDYKRANSNTTGLEKLVVGPQSAIANSSRPRSQSKSSNPNIGSGNDSSNKILEIMLNLILTICDSQFYSFSSNQSNQQSEESANKKKGDSITRKFFPEEEGFVSDTIPSCASLSFPTINNTAVLCSAALSNLAEVPQCRQGCT